MVAPIPAPASKYFSISAHKFVCLEFCFALFCSVRFGTILFCSCTCLPVVGDHLKSLKQNTTNCFNSQVYWFKKPSITFFCVCMFCLSLVLSWKNFPNTMPELAAYFFFGCLSIHFSPIFSRSYLLTLKCNGKCSIGETLLSGFHITSII